MASQRNEKMQTTDQVEKGVNGLLSAMTSRDTRTFTAAIKTLRKSSKQTGLSPEQISRIILRIPKVKFKNPERIFCLLLPNDSVLVESVVNVIFWFNSLSVQVQNELDTMIAIIKWVIIIYPFIDNQLLLNEHYDLVMHYISSQCLAPYICHLLAFMTRGEDVKTFRVMQILSLNFNLYFLPEEFDGLLILYKRLRTDDLNLNVSSVVNNIVLFTCPDEKMQEEIYKLRMNLDNATTRSLKESPIFARSPIELLSKNDKIHLPQDWYNLFTSETVDCEHPMLTQLSALLFNHDHSSLCRILFWIDQAICTFKQLNTGEYLAERDNILKLDLFPTLPFQIEMTFTALVLTLTKIADFLNQSIPTFGEILKTMLPIWKNSYPPTILFESLKQIDLHSFLDLKNTLEKRIKNELMQSEDNSSFIFGLINCLCDLMNNWLFRSNTNLIVSPDKLTDISAILNTSAHHEENLVHAFNEFIEFAFMLAKYILYDNNSELEIQVAIIRLLIQIAQIPLRHEIPLLYLPHPNLFYDLFLTHSPIVFDFLFKLLTSYFQAFGKIKQLSPKVYYGCSMQEMVESFNNIMVVILYKLLPSPDMPIHLQEPVFTMPKCVIEHFGIKREENSLLICNHWAIRGFVAMYFELTQPATNSRSVIHHPLSILESKVRTQEFLAFLEEYCHFTGLTNFWKLVRNDS